MKVLGGPPRAGSPIRACAGPSGWGVRDRILTWAARRIEAWQVVTVRRRTIRELCALDDRTLNDIGLRRSQIDALILVPGRRRPAHR